MSQTSAEAAIMESTAKRFEDVKGSLDKMLSDLMLELDGLKTQWQGRSGRSFDNVKVTYQQNQNALVAVLQETANGIRTSGRQYTASDDQAASQMGAISTDINLPL